MRISSLLPILLLNLALLALPRGAAEQPKHVKDPGTAPVAPTGEIGPVEDEPLRHHVNSSEDPLRSPTASDPTQQGPCEKKLSASELADLPWDDSVQSSRRGGIYFLSGSERNRQLFFQASPTAERKRVPNQAGPVEAFRLSPDGARLITLERDKSGGHLFQIPTDSMQITPLPQEKEANIELGAWSADSKRFAFTSDARSHGNFDLHLFDLAANKTSRLTELQGINLVSDLSRDGKYILIERRPNEEVTTLSLWDLSKAKMISVTGSTSEQSLNNGRFSRDSKSILALGMRSPRALFRISLAHPESAKPFGSGNREIDLYAMASDRSSILYTYNEGGYSKLEGYQVTPTGERKQLLILPKLRNGVVGSLWIEGGTPLPASYYSLGSYGNRQAIWSYLYPKEIPWSGSDKRGLASLCLAPETKERLSSEKDHPLDAYLYRPKDSPGDSNGPLPALVYLDGSNAGFRPEFSPVVQYFVDRGYVVLVPLMGTKVDEAFTKQMGEVARWLIDKRLSRVGEILIWADKEQAGGAIQAMVSDPLPFGAVSGVDPKLASLPSKKMTNALLLFQSEPTALSEWIKHARTLGLTIETRAVPNRGFELASRMERAKQTLYFFEDLLKKKKGS